MELPASGSAGLGQRQESSGGVLAGNCMKGIAPWPNKRLSPTNHSLHCAQESEVGSAGQQPYRQGAALVLVSFPVWGSLSPPSFLFLLLSTS